MYQQNGSRPILKAYAGNAIPSTTFKKHRPKMCHEIHWCLSKQCTIRPLLNFVGTGGIQNIVPCPNWQADNQPWLSAHWNMTPYADIAIPCSYTTHCIAIQMWFSSLYQLQTAKHKNYSWSGSENYHMWNSLVNSDSDFNYISVLWKNISIPIKK